MFCVREADTGTNQLTGTNARMVLNHEILTKMYDATSMVVGIELTMSEGPEAIIRYLECGRWYPSTSQSLRCPSCHSDIAYISSLGDNRRQSRLRARAVCSRLLHPGNILAQLSIAFISTRAYWTLLQKFSYVCCVCRSSANGMWQRSVLIFHATMSLQGRHQYETLE